MRKVFLYIFLVFLILGFLVSPKIGKAEDKKIQLTLNEKEFILNAVQRKLNEKGILMWAEPDINPEEQAAIVLVQRAIQKEMFSFFFKDVPKQVTMGLIETTLKVARLFLGEEVLSNILSEIERTSVTMAKEYLTKYLLEYEIKTANGNLDYSYTSYKGTSQKVSFQYIITYKYAGNNEGGVAIEFYSPKTTEPPSFNQTTPCDLNRDLEPFILRINGKLGQVSGAYYWPEEPEIEVVFDEPVPEFDFQEPGILEQIGAKFNEMMLVTDKATEIIKTIFSNTNYQAALSPALLEESAPEAPGIPEVTEIQVQPKPEIKQEIKESKKELSLEEIQERIDDISEKIDIISQEVTDLVGIEEGPAPEKEIVLEPTPELQPEPQAEVAPERVGQVEIRQAVKIGGSSSPRPSYPKILISGIQISPIEQRFIELYNPNIDQVNLNDWYIQRKTETSTSWNSLVSSTQFEGKTIPAKSHFFISRARENSDILLSDLTLIENNSLVLKNPNREIVDLVGWGQAQDYEGAAAENPADGKSLARKWDESSGNYIDTDNNLNDFEVQLAGEAQAPEIPPPADTTPPEIIFNLEPVQTSLSFTLSWTGEDPIGDTTPSGIDGFLLQYETGSIETTTPTTEEAIALRYDENGEWQDWALGEVLEFGEEKNSLSLLGKDEYVYNFKIQAKDKAGNLSDWQEGSTIIKLPKKVLINEVQIDSLPGAGGADDDWVELYNPGDFDIDLSQWSIQRSPESGKIYEKHFESGHKIPAKGYFLIVRNNASQKLLDIADMSCSALQLSSNSTVYLVKNQEKIEGGDDLDIVDKVGFGEKAFSAEGNPAPEPPEGQSLERKELGLDTDDNSQDFEIEESPSPTNSQAQTISLPCLPKLETLIEGDFLSSPVIGSDGTIYLATSSGLSAFYYNGSPKWAYEQNSILGTPALWEPTETIYIFSKEEGILAINIKDGSLKWKKQFNILATSAGPILGDDGKIYFITEDSGLIVLDENGEQSWFYDLGSISGPVSNIVVDKNGNAYFGYGNTLFAVNSDGEKWERTFTPRCKIYTCQPWISNLSIADDRTIYVMVPYEEDFLTLTDAGTSNCLHALGPENPESENWPALCWRFTLIPIVVSSQGNIYSSVSWLNLSAVFMTRIVAYDSQGQSLTSWQSPAFMEVGGAVSIITDKEETVYVFFGYYDNSVKALGPNGEEKWSLKLERGTGTIFPLVLGGDGTLFVPTQKKLFIIRP